MVTPMDILRKGKETLQELDEASKEGVDRIRDILPGGRGGSPPDKDFVIGDEYFVFERADPIPLRDVPTTPEYAVNQASAEVDNPALGFARAFERQKQRQMEREQMRTEDIVREMVNDPMITVTEDMLEIINDPAIMMDSRFNLFRNQFARSELLQQPKKKKRKVSKYQKELGRQLKMLKKKHPRTPISSLMKRAHRLTRKALK